MIKYDFIGDRVTIVIYGDCDPRGAFTVPFVYIKSR